METQSVIPGTSRRRGTTWDPDNAESSRYAFVRVSLLVLILSFMLILSSHFSLFITPDSTNSGDNMYTMISTVPPGGSRPNVRNVSLRMSLCLSVIQLVVDVRVLWYYNFVLVTVISLAAVYFLLSSRWVQVATVRWEGWREWSPITWMDH